MWYNIYEYLSEERQLDVSLSNPFKTRAIASAKTDKLDAVKLADLLRGGYIQNCTGQDSLFLSEWGSLWSSVNGFPPYSASVFSRLSCFISSFFWVASFAVSNVNNDVPFFWSSYSF